MIPKPLPFLCRRNRSEEAARAARKRGKHRMTLVSALMGREGVVIFCDTQETVGGYSKKNVDKMTVWSFPDSPFRFAISGATDDATYLDMLERALSGTLLSMDTYSLAKAETSLTKTLTEFYSKHIWPQAARAPLTEFLIVIQPLPSGRPDVIHISGTAVTIPSLSHPFKNIGVGAHLADYLFSLLLGGGQTQVELAIVGAYVGKQVNENVDGCGPVERIVLLGNNGQNEELTSEDIKGFENNLHPIGEVIQAAFIVAASVADPKGHETELEYIAAELQEIRAGNAELWDSIQEKIRQAAEYREQYEPRRKSSPFC
jgi:hypothetical protein